MPETSKTARGIVRIYKSGCTPTEHYNPWLSCSLETEVEILSETPDAFYVKYSTQFKNVSGEGDLPDIIKKDDNLRKLRYTIFTATDALPATGAVRHARITFNVERPGEGIWSFDTVDTDVLIVDETDTHYRLRFTAKFAKQHTRLCMEWMSKASSGHNFKIATELTGVGELKN